MDKQVKKNNVANNPYQYTRGIRFSLEPVQEAQDFLKLIPESQETQIDLTQLGKDLISFYSKLNKLLLYYNKQKDKKEFYKSLSVNKNWIKRWHTEIFYMLIKNRNNQQGKYKLIDLHNELKKWFEVWKHHSEAIQEISKKLENNKSRDSEIFHHIKELISVRKLSYIESFLEELHGLKYSNLDKIKKELEDKVKKIAKNLKLAREEYALKVSSSIEIAKASFNYYTVNKKSKEYYKEEIECSEKDLYEKKYATVLSNKIKTIEGADVLFNSEQEKEWVKRFFKNKLNKEFKKDETLSLDETYRVIKDFKSEQKAIFYTLIPYIIKEKIDLDGDNQKTNYQDRSLLSSYTSYSNKKPSQDNFFKVKNKNLILYGYEFKKITKRSQLNNLFSLFNNDTAIKEFMEITKKLEKELNSEKKTALAKKRGKLLFRKTCKFQKYDIICKKHETIAKKRGKLIAQIKGIKTEKLESQQIQFWSMIYNLRDQKQLWLIPKSKRKEAYNFIYKPKREAPSWDSEGYLCCFESLTMRALHKLCFAEQSTFVKEMPEDLKNKQKEVKKIKTKNKDEFQEKQTKIMAFLKEILISDYAKEKLSLKEYDINQLNKATTFKDFEKQVENLCYHVKKVSLTNNEIQSFINDYDVTVLNVSSYDLQERNKNAYQTPESENRIHTDWWNELWKQQRDLNIESSTVREFGKIRLNPEFKIHYRKKDENLENYLKKRGFSVEDKNFKNRKIKNQMTVHFTLSLNAGKIYEDLAFANTEDLKEKIEKFNKELNQDKNFKTAWYYGVDLGNIELATLCIVKFRDNKLEPVFLKLDKDIQCYSLTKYNLQEIKKESEKIRFAVQNMSYFMKEKYLSNTKYFKKEDNLTCLDLTVAKVMKGKIITNGDIMTYLKLKKSVAKRRIFELYGKRVVNSSSKLEWKSYKDGKLDSERPKGVLTITTNEGEKTIYWYCTKYEDILIDSRKSIKYTQESIKNSLSFYLESLKKSNNNEHTPSIQKINHLRDALVSNMVGVISHLQKKYHGFIVLENLSKDTIDKHFSQHNENISRRLEKALYNKFQTLGLVPPHVKDIIQLKEDQKMDQIGVISFVSEENTSKTCPYCEEITNQDNDLKFNQKRFLCKKEQCGFDTYFFKDEKDRVQNYKPSLNIKNKNKEEFKKFKDIDDPDKVAAFNVAKKRMKNWQK